MGREARCRVRFGGTNEVVDVYLSSSQLEVGSSPAMKLPLTGMKIASIEGGWLTIATANGPMALELGPAAGKWGRAIANPKTRLDKLGITKGSAACVIGFEDPSFEKELAERNVTITRAPKGRETLIVFLAENARSLARLRTLRNQIHDHGALWVVRVKGKDATVTEAASREAAREAGLVDVKVESFDDTHSAEKYVVPLARRAR